jgi:hypothetical protein
MTLIKIINGVYGYRPEKSPYVIPVSSSDPAISVDDAEAEHLVNIGVAAYVGRENDAEAVATALSCDSDSCPIDHSPDDGDGENGDPAPGEITATLDPEDLKNWKMDDLRKLAADMGIDATGIKKKDDLVAAIAAVEVTVPADAPDLGIEDVVE